MIPVTVKLTQLNRRINDGGQIEGSESVYLWVIMFALDGTTITQNGVTLAGSPQWFFSAGSDGNLNQDVSQGEGIGIPASVGNWFLNLAPIAINDPTLNPPTIDVPATIVVIAVLMDDGLTPTEDMEVGHQALNNFVQGQINNFVSGINLLTVSDAVNVLIAKGQSAAAATVSTIQDLLKPVIASIENGASTIVYNAVKSSLGLGGAIGSILDPDSQIGNEYLTIGQDQLMNLDPLGGTSYTPSQFQIVFPTSNDNYYLFGFAQNLDRVAVIPQGVPPGRWQVTGINKGYSSTLRSSFIKEIGGQLADGNQWYLERAAAIGLIKSGVNSFYVLGADGSESNVIVSDKPIDGTTDLETYLTTTPDKSLEDNLDSLPPFGVTYVMAGATTP